MRPTAEALNAVLPQLQCTRCGFEGCAPYAQAMAEGQAPSNRCEPGGLATHQALARMCNTPEQALPKTTLPPVWATGQVAWVNEDACIGCTLCLKVCPTDALVGASLQQHTVVRDDCTGCRLCVPACPTDCIAIVPHGTLSHHDPNQPADQERAQERLQRFEAHQAHRSQADQLRQTSKIKHDLRAALQRVARKRQGQAHEPTPC